MLSISEFEKFGRNNVGALFVLDGIRETVNNLRRFAHATDGGLQQGLIWCV